MANLRTSSDILKDILFRCGEPTDGTSDFHDQALSDLNRAYQGLCTGGSELVPNLDEDWWWLKKATPGVLTLLPGITLGSVSVTQGSTAIVFSTPPVNCFGQSQSVQGWFLDVGSDNGDVYMISAHTAGQTNATLDSVYTDVTQAAGSYRAYALQYALATDCQKIIGPMRCYQQSRNDIDYCEKGPMRTQFPLNTVPQGTPRLFAFVGEQKVEFSHYPGDNSSLIMRVEYDYQMVASDLLDDGGTTAPLTPFNYNRVLSDWGTYFLMLNKDDTRTTVIVDQAKTSLEGMIKENRRRMVKAGSTLGMIYPRMRDKHRFDQPLRTSSGLIIG